MLKEERWQLDKQIAEGRARLPCLDKRPQTRREICFYQNVIPESALADAIFEKAIYNHFWTPCRLYLIFFSLGVVITQIEE